MKRITDPNLLGQVDALQADYVSALDAREMHAWLACFADDGSYELTTVENLRLDLPVGLMLDDCHARLRDRVKYVNEVWNHAVEHYQTRHLITRVRCEQAADQSLHLRTHFSVYYANAEGHSALLTMGEYHDVVIQHADGLRFRSKRAVLDGAVPPRYLIYPI